MKIMPEDNPYAQGLISLIVSISREIPMDEEDKVLIVMKLDSKDKILKFNDWVKSRMDGEILRTTAPEIVRAAVNIGKEI